MASKATGVKRIRRHRHYSFAIVVHPMGGIMCQLWIEYDDDEMVRVMLCDVMCVVTIIDEQNTQSSVFIFHRMCAS